MAETARRLRSGSRIMRVVAAAQENSQQYDGENRAHGPPSHPIQLATRRPADFMASASRTAAFKPLP
jgi:hypothetical protein